LQLIYLLTTGGTIEKAYSEKTGVVANAHSKIDRHLSLLRLPDSQVKIVQVLNKDSLEMEDSDREIILSMVKSLLSERAPIVITHGTDTMVQTGLHLLRSLPALNSTIILTGAMTPLGFEGSDGLQNLTESLFAARVLGPGIYIVLHGQAFPADRVRKDRDLVRFVPIEQG
jgi:L-asparaginase